MEASATSISLEIAIPLLFAVLLFWFFFSRHNPLWNYRARRPRTLEDQKLDRKLHGLILFGLPGSSYEFVETESEESFSFVKVSGAGESMMNLRVRSNIPEAELAERLERQATLTFRAHDKFARTPTDGHFELKCDDHNILAAFGRALATAMEHAPNARYRCASDGPEDKAAIREYFGFDDHAA